ncbi:MAG: helix-turn-helix domain-containing protein [Pseudomonadota bacterium]
MKYKSYKEMNCSMAQALDAIGERWALLILREAFYGRTRFNQFLDGLGISRNILTARLNHLVAEGLLEKRPATETAHAEYVLTEAGRAMRTVILSLIHWGDEFRPHEKGPRLQFVEATTGEAVRKMGIYTESGVEVQPGKIKVVPGPGVKRSVRKSRLKSDQQLSPARTQRAASSQNVSKAKKTARKKTTLKRGISKKSS